MRMVLQVSIVDLAVADSTLVMLNPNALNDEMESMLQIHETRSATGHAARIEKQDSTLT